MNDIGENVVGLAWMVWPSSKVTTNWHHFYKKFYSAFLKKELLLKVVHHIPYLGATWLNWNSFSITIHIKKKWGHITWREFETNPLAIRVPNLNVSQLTALLKQIPVSLRVKVKNFMTATMVLRDLPVSRLTFCLVICQPVPAMLTSCYSLTGLTTFSHVTAFALAAPLPLPQTPTWPAPSVLLLHHVLYERCFNHSIDKPICPI